MPHTLEWFDHADPPKRGVFEHSDDMLDPHVLARFAETLLQQSGVTYEPPIRIVYTSVDHRVILGPPQEGLFWSILQPAVDQRYDQSE